MALLGSKQLNSRLTGSFTLSGSLAGDSASTGSFGRLDVSGNSSIIGDLTLGGDIQIGDSSGDSITITADLTSNLIPNADNTYDLGTSTKNWRYGYIAQVIGDSVTTSGNVSGSSTSSGSFGRLETAGNISASGTVTAEHFYSTDDAQVVGTVNSGYGIVNYSLLVNSNSHGGGDFRVKSANNDYMLFSEANQDNI